MLTAVNDDGSTRDGSLNDEHVREDARVHTTAKVLDALTESARPAVRRVIATLVAPAMALRLIESARARWGAANAPHLVASVRAGARFERGRLVERRAVAA